MKKVNETTKNFNKTKIAEVVKIKNCIIMIVFN